MPMPPVINSIVAVPDSILPGEVSVVTFDVTSDEFVGLLSGVASNSFGDSLSVDISLTIGDVVALALGYADPSRVSIIQRPAPDQNIFDVTAL